MKKVYKFLSLLTLALLSSYAGKAQNAWINEIHYDNASTDVGEFIEVVIENAGSYALSDFSVVLYNGSNGLMYDTKTLDQFTSGSIIGNFSIFYYPYPSNGIQNGAPDGMALVYQGAVVSGQWLSYEGTMTAADGPANGMLSVDIGVMEAGTDPAGNSLQLSGTGTLYTAFAWQPPAAETPGAINNDQSFGGAPLPEPTNYPTSFASSPDNITVALTWIDATGDQLPSKYLILISDQDNITAPTDGTPVPDDLDLTDGTGAYNVTYGAQAYTFYHLMGETGYFFEIYPYTNAGAAIDYKTDGTAPATSATTEPLINLNDFEDNTFGDWTTYTVASDKDWAVVSFGGALSTTYFAQMNGFNENEPSNDWLISPVFNLDSYANEKMVFYTQYKYGDTDAELTLKYSTDYTGGDPTLASWTDLSFTKPAGEDTWTISGNVDLSTISGSTVSIAFQYLSSGNPRRWGVDEIVITGYAIVPVISVLSPVEGDFWEQGTTHDISWDANNTSEFLTIELTTDASAGSPTWTTLTASVAASAGSWTWNISPSQTTSEDCKIRISDNTAEVSALSGTFSLIEPIYVPQLVITEIMYNPPEGGTDSLEFIELYNNDDIMIDLEGYYFSDGVTFTFPAVTMNPGDYIVVAVDSLVFLDFFGVNAYQWTGGLSNSGELILLRNNYGMTVDSVLYDDVEPWPTEPDGSGPSLRFCDAGLDNSVADFWGVSIEFAGINGDGDTVWASPGAGCANWPTAEFSADNTVILAGSSVNFTDESTGDPDSWVWTFPGGTPGSFIGQAPPAIVYNNPGSYNVILYVENVAGTSTKMKENYITVGVAPEAGFSATPLNLYAGETVNFTDESTGDPDTWEWSFEGGTPATSTEQSPSGILYSTAGVYDVTLIVTNTFGTDTLTMTEYIDVLPVGIDEQASNVMRVYPNPNNGSFKLNNVSGEELRMTVSSLVGKTVYEASLTPGEHSFNLSDLSNGMYIIQVRDNNGNVMNSQKVMIF